MKEILVEREKTHGDFEENGTISQALKNVMRNAVPEGWERLRPLQQEALDQAALKISRILSGNPDHPDHWIDPIGYFTRVLEDIQRRG